MPRGKQTEGERIRHEEKSIRENYSDGNSFN
jgi:hypothetical protein